MEWETLEILKTAVHFEKEGMKAYLKYAMKTNSTPGKDMYINLALDEHHHAQKLHGKLNELLSELLKRGTLGSQDTEHIFSMGSTTEGEVKPQPEVPAQEGAILELAIENEKESKRFYNQQAENCGDPILKALYRGLAKEEEGHEMLLRAELDSVKGSGHWFDFREFTLEAPG